MGHILKVDLTGISSELEVGKRGVKMWEREGGKTFLGFRPVHERGWWCQSGKNGGKKRFGRKRMNLKFYFHTVTCVMFPGHIQRVWQASWSIRKGQD